MLELLFLASTDRLLAQPAEHMFEQCEHPLFVVEPIRSQVVCWLQAEPSFTRVEVQWDRGLPASSFEGSGFVPFIRQKVFERRQQERAEFATVRLRDGEEVLLQKLGKELLCQVLRLVHVPHPTTDVRIEWVPVSTAQCRQGSVRTGRRTVTRCQDKAPVSGLEVTIARR